jgi:glycosyltransferase involved in cell wall biosynthesis
VDELSCAGATVWQLGAPRLRRPDRCVRAQASLLRLIRARRPDAVVTHGMWVHALFGSVVKHGGAQLVNWVHGVIARAGLLERAANLVPPDLVIANSSATRSALPVFRSAPIEVLHCPVAPPDATRVDGRAVRAQLGVGASEVVVTILSRIEALKGHALLVDALARLGSDPRWTAWIVGGAQRESERRLLSNLEARVRTSGLGDRVRFLGQRSDAQALLAASDVYCQPNVAPEGFGISFIEALYSGVPVVTTKMGGALDIVDDSCGALVEPDPAAVAAGVELFLDAERRRGVRDDCIARARVLSDPVRQLERFGELLSAQRLS